MQGVQLFRSLVSNQNGTPITTSNKIANVFGKQHKNVLRAIERLDCSHEFSQLNFAPAEYIDEQGKPRPSFNMTTTEILQKLDYLAGINGSKKADIEAAICALYCAEERK